MMRYRVLAILAVAAAAAALPGQAAEVVTIEADRADGRIEVRSTILFDAPRSVVFDALTDYGRFDELSSRYRESRFIEPAADGTPRIYTRVEGCVLFYCRRIERYARLETDPPGSITALVEPSNSDFEYGREHWELADTATGTRVDYRHEFDPSFWVPPVIGIWAIRRALRKDALAAAQRIERLAVEQADSE